MRSLAVVTTCALFASMLAWSSSGRAAAAADTTLSFERDGAVVKTIDRRDLERAVRSGHDHARRPVLRASHALSCLSSRPPS